MKKQMICMLLTAMAAFTGLCGCSTKTQGEASDTAEPQRIGAYEISVSGYRIERKFPDQRYGMIDVRVKNISGRSCCWGRGDMLDGVRGVSLESGDRRAGIIQSEDRKILPGQTIAGTIIFPAYRSWNHIGRDQATLTIEGNVNGGGEWKNGAIRFVLHSDR